MSKGRRVRQPRPRQQPNQYPRRATQSDQPVLHSNLFAEVLPVTCLIEAPVQPTAGPVVVRFTGNLLDGNGKPRPGAWFTNDTTVESGISGSGPITISARVSVPPGEYRVSAYRILPEHHQAKGKQQGNRVTPESIPMANWSRLRRKVSPATTAVVETYPAPLVHLPGSSPFAFPILVSLGFVVAFLVQGMLISTKHLQIEHLGMLSALTVLSAAIGGKLWFRILHRGEENPRLPGEGWCIQGFIVGGMVSVLIFGSALQVSLTTYLDSMIPGLLMGMGIGRLGCFFTGCCNGRPTSSRWGVWSSNRTVGCRRIPTQPMESVLALVVGLAAMAAFTARGPDHGLLFISGLSGYTLFRQAILRYREERRKTDTGWKLTAGIAAFVLAVGIVLMVTIPL